MQKQTIYFKTTTDLPSSHPDYAGTEHWVGEAVATDEGEDGLHIDIKSLYLRIDPNVNETPLGYYSLDPYDPHFQYAKKSGNEFGFSRHAGQNTFDKIIFDVCDRFGKVDADNADAKTICDYYSQRDAIGENDSVKVTVHSSK